MLVDPSIWRIYRKHPHDLRPVYHELTAALTSLGIHYHLLAAQDQPLDIWIRDWGPSQGHFFRYRPSYAPGFYSPETIWKARHGLKKVSRCSFRSIPLVLDGGNLVHNGKVAILTEKVLQDNPQFTVREIRAMIGSLGFDQVLFIPIEPEDEVGHADGIVRFISTDVLLMNDYASAGFGDYHTQLLERLAEMPSHTNIAPFPWLCSAERTGRVWSAVGVYLNFVQTAKGILYPVFGEPEDHEAAALFESLGRMPTLPIPCRELARLGGALHCVTANVQ